MSSEFNTYSSWLGIPEDEQPPHYYRLLGLEPFENDPDAIRQAGKRLLGMVKAKERGPNGTAARRLRAEITFAASCLLDAKKKAKYDTELDAWFNEYEEDAGYGGDEYELEEPNLPMAKIVTSGSSKTVTKSRGGSSKSKSSGRIKTGSSKGRSGSSKGKKKKSKAASAGLMSNPKILVAVILLVVAVLGLGGGLAFVFLRSDPPVAVKDEKANTDAAALPDEDEEEAEAAAKKSEEEEEEEGATTTDETAEEKQEEENTPEGEAEKTADGEDKTGDTVDTEKKEDPEAKSPADADPMTPTAGESPAKPGEKTDPKKTDPKADPKTEEPKKEEPPKEEKDPFQDLQEALELPVFVDAQTSTTPVVLAKVYPKEGDRVNVILSGGEAVLGELGSFSLRGGLLTDPEPKWTVNFTDPTGAKTPVAQMAYKDNEVSFAWTGQGDATINNLMRNCMLKITAGYGNRNLPLRKPVIIEPLPVAMDQKGSVIDLPVVGMPEDEEAVTMEITKLLGGFPSDPTYDPPGGTLKPGESVDIMFAKVDLAFRAKFIHERDGTMKLDFRPMIRGERKGRGPRPLKPYVLKQSFEQMITEKNNLLTIGTANYEKFKAANSKNKDLLAQAELKYQEALRMMNDQIKALTDLKMNVDTLAKEGKVQFRIYMRVGAADAIGPDTYTLELLKTKDYTPVEPDPKKPAAKKK